LGAIKSKLNHQSRHVYYKFLPVLDSGATCYLEWPDADHPSCFFKQHRRLGRGVKDWPASSLQSLPYPPVFGGSGTSSQLFQASSPAPNAAIAPHYPVPPPQRIHILAVEASAWNVFQYASASSSLPGYARIKPG
jgi:hypothetical protein